MSPYRQHDPKPAPRFCGRCGGILRRPVTWSQLGVTATLCHACSAEHWSEWHHRERYQRGTLIIDGWTPKGNAS